MILCFGLWITLIISCAAAADLAAGRQWHPCQLGQHGEQQCSSSVTVMMDRLPACVQWSVHGVRQLNALRCTCVFFFVS